MKTVKIGGVPEHFNYPWYLTLKKKAYTPLGINLRWKDCYGGTGEMCAALRDGSIDIAVVLTEGIVRDIANGNPSKIVQTFVSSPLIWGIHVAHNAAYTTIEDLKGTEAAISRYGSGSHLMAYVHAVQQKWNLAKDLKFKEIKDLKGALTMLPQGIGSYFMWEKFTTKPYVDQGVFRRIGECPTPWPCFVIAVRESFLEEHSEKVAQILNIINAETINFKQQPNIVSSLAKRYKQKELDISQWLSQTEWAQEQLDNKTINTVQQQLAALNLIDETKESDFFLKKIDL